MNEKFFTFEPKLVESSAEPNLRQLIYRYYRQHFEQDKATMYTNEYIAKFNELEDPEEIDTP